MHNEETTHRRSGEACEQYSNTEQEENDKDEEDNQKPTVELQTSTATQLTKIGL